jgi:hypothetical protein
MTGQQELPPQFSDRAFRVGSALAHVGESRLRGSDLAQPYRGVRVPVSAPRHPLEVVNRCLDYAPLLLPGQFFSHTTAAEVWQLPVPRTVSVIGVRPGAAPLPGAVPRSGPGGDASDAPAPLHVSGSFGNRPRRPGVVGHRASADHPVVRRFGLPVSSAAATWREMASLLDLDDLIALGDAIVLDPRVQDPHNPRPYATRAELMAAVAGSRARGVRKALAALAEIRVGAESRPETLLRLMLVRAGLPEPECNIDVMDRNGKWIGRADLVWPQWRTLTEYDGEQHRTDSTQYARDERRIEEFTHAQWHVVRVRKAGVFGGGRQDTVERVARALRAGGWRG